MDNLLKKRQNINPKFFIIPSVVVLIILIISFVFIYLPARNVYSQSMSAVLKGKTAYEYLKKQDIEKASEEIAGLKIQLELTKKAYKNLLWTKYIPFFGSYTGDGERMLNAAIYSVEAGQITIDSVKPYADVLGLKGQGSFVMGSAEERIQKAVKTLEKVVPNISKVTEKIELAKNEMNQVDERRYAFKLKNINLKESIAMAKTTLTEGTMFLKEAEPAIKILPSLLGEPNEARYLILFQNDKELRSTGGFITAYSIFKVKSGKIEVEKSEDIYELDKRIASREKPPEMVTKYLKNIFYWNARDTNLSPDFKISMDKFYELYKRDDSKPINGIIALDTQFLSSILKIIGEIEIYGIKFNADIEPACNCTKAVYELEKYSTTQVDYVKEGRKDIIGQLMFAMMKKILSSPPKIYWGPIFQTSINMLNQKHMLIYLFDKGGQQGIESLNWGGRIRSYEGDYLHINDTNLGGAKTDMFLVRSVEQTVEIQADRLIRNVKIKYNNPYPASNCNLEQKAVLCLNSLYRSVVRVYVPKGSKLNEKETRGSETKIKTYQEFGKTVFEGFFTMYPEHQATLEFSYEVPMTIKGEYKLLIQKQPGLELVKYATSVNGKTAMTDLVKDEEIKIKL
jgi:hypothetical protein